MFGIVYSSNTGRIRWFTDRTVTPAFLNSIPLLPGEAMLQVNDNSLFTNLDAMQVTLVATTKKTPKNDRYALVDATNTVVGTVILDPQIDTPPTGTTAVADATATKGDKYDPVKKIFTKVVKNA